MPSRLAPPAPHGTPTEFLATVTHEVRTPLNAVIGMTELLRQMSLPPDAARLVETIHMSGEHLLAIVNDLLDVARVDAGRLALEQVDFVLRDVVEEVIEIAAATAGTKRLSVGAIIDPSLPDEVRGDPKRLGQVLANLLSNAVKFTAAGFVRLRLTRVSIDGDVCLCRVDVEDSGIGIAREVVPRLFQPFVQADEATSRRYGGTGLGLSIASGIVTAMGSRITVESAPGAGSRFTFDLRVPRGRHDALALPSCADLHVVFASRDSVLVDALHAQAARLGLDLHVASGAAQMHRFLEARPAVVLVDSRLDDAPGVRSLVTHAGVARVEVLDSRAVVVGDGAQLCLRTPVRLSALAHVLTTLRPADCSVPPAPTLALPRGRWCVLVVDDNRASQELVARVLAGVGVHADLVDTGEAAQAAVLRQRYDLVLMDCRMPGMDGLETTRAIRASECGRGLPIIGLTASALPGMRQACFEAGMSDFLAKPARPSAIVDMLRRWLTAGRTLAEPAAERRVTGGDVESTLLDVGAVAELQRLGMLADIAVLVTRDAPARLAELKAAVAHHDLARVSGVAHRLTTLLGNVGWSQAAAMAACLECACDDPDGGQHLALAETLSAVVTAGLPEIERVAGHALQVRR